MRNIFKSFDDFFINLINLRIKNKYLDVFMFRVTDLGGAIFITVFTFGLVLFGSSKNKVIGVEALVSLGISQIIVHSLKKILSRERPYNILKHLNTFGIDLSDYSFPSGHTTASFSLATTLALNIPRISIIMIFLALVIGMSRIYLGVHYPTDVAAGIILGVGSAFLVHMYLIDFVRNLSGMIGINL